MKKILTIPARILFAWLIVLIPVGLLVIAMVGSATKHKSIKAQKGVLDLTSWQPTTDGNTNLDGEWSFYWHRLLVPTDFETNHPPSSDGYIQLPSIWNNMNIAGTKLSGKGYATFKLDIPIDSTNHLYALKILTVSNAYRLWVNNELVASNGKVGTNKENSHPAYKPQIVAFSNKGKIVHLLLQVSNFDHWKGGVWYAIKLGTLEQIVKERENKLILEIFLFGCLFIMAIYHFGLYFLRKKEPSTLYFGLICTAICLRSLFVGENIINAIWPSLDWFVARKIEYVLTFFTVPIYITFVRSLFPEEIRSLLYKIFCYIGILLILFVLFTPVDIYTFSSYIFTLYSWIASLYVIYVIILASIKKREGAILFLTTSLFFMLTIINDTLNQTEVLQTGLYLPFGLLVVVFAQSYILSSRSAHSFHTTEIYAATFQKFVPLQFLKRIAKEGIQSIKPGNAEKGELTVLFCDIRSFTTLSENMSPDEVFKMLNKYLSYVEPPIRNNHGFVDKYMGDGIMALFEKDEQHNSAYNAVTAALQMKNALAVYNEQRQKANKPVLKIGIGLHTGQVVIGTIGGDERMDSTAIGDAVNLASRIESMTKTYDAMILASEDTINLLGEYRDQFILRFVDSVVVKGKTAAINIWEITDLVR